MGHLRGGSDDLVDLLEGGEGGAVAAEEAEAEGAGVGACGADGIAGGPEDEGIITIGAGDGGCGIASFLRIVISQSCCFICSSTISLESTSLKIEQSFFNYVPTKKDKTK